MALETAANEITPCNISFYCRSWNKSCHLDRPISKTLSWNGHKPNVTQRESVIPRFSISWVFLNSLIHHHMWGQKNSTLTICKSAETSGLILQRSLDSNTEKGPQKISVHGSTCNIYLEKENVLELTCFTCYLKQIQLYLIGHFTARVKSLHMQEGAQQLNSGHSQRDLELWLPPHSFPA